MSFIRKMGDRSERLLLTMVSKKWVVFFLSTGLLIFKFIPPEVWAFQAAFTVGAEITSNKVLGRSEPNESL